MKILFLLCTLVLPLKSSTAAEDMRIAPESKESSGCDLSVAGFNSKETFIAFFQEVKKAVAASDKKRMADMVFFPLQGKIAKKLKITNKAAFEKNYSKLFTDKIKKRLEEQKLETLFCNHQGAMVGDGEIWIGQSGEKIGIVTINQ